MPENTQMNKQHLSSKSRCRCSRHERKKESMPSTQKAKHNQSFHLQTARAGRDEILLCQVQLRNHRYENVKQAAPAVPLSRPCKLPTTLLVAVSSAGAQQLGQHLSRLIFLSSFLLLRFLFPPHVLGGL